MGMSVGGAASCASPILRGSILSSTIQPCPRYGVSRAGRSTWARRWNRGPSRPEDEPSTSFVAASRRDHVPFSSGARPAGIDVRKQGRNQGLSGSSPPPSTLSRCRKATPPCGGRWPCASLHACRRRGGAGLGGLECCIHGITAGNPAAMICSSLGAEMDISGCIGASETLCLSVISRPAKARHIRKSKQSRLNLRHFGEL